MRRVAETGGIESLRGMRLGRLMPMVRNRAVGHETSAAVDSPDGGLQISAETEMAFNEVALRQSVVATYDEMLRPERCYVDATINSRTMQIEVVVGHRDAVVRICGDAGDEESTIPLCGRPLLLIDNCFTLHALAAWSIARCVSSERGDPEVAVYTALPVGRDLRTSRRRPEHIYLGGVDLGRPSVTLHLGPDLDEHAWFVDNRLERLAIPRLHLRVDRIDDWTLNGEEECTKR